MSKKLDERQLLIRGKAYAHFFIMVSTFLLSNAVLVTYGYNIAEGPWSYLLISIIPTSIVTSEMLLKDALVFRYRYLKHFWVIFVAFAFLFFSILAIVDFASGVKFFADKCLSASASCLIFGIVYLVILFAFLLKRIKDARKLKKEEEGVL